MQYHPKEIFKGGVDGVDKLLIMTMFELGKSYKSLSLNSLSMYSSLNSLIQFDLKSNFKKNLEKLI